MSCLQELFVEVTNRCLLSCVHCSSCASPGAEQFIPLKKITSMIKETKGLGLKQFTISGGEPLLYPDLFLLLAFIKKQNLSCCLYTCGIMENDGRLDFIDDGISKALFDLKIDKIIFSLQGGSEQVHDQITGIPESFNLTLKSIDKVISKGLQVELHFVPMKLNIEDIESVVKTAQEIGVNRVSLLRLVPQGRCENKKDLLLSPSEGLKIAQSVKYLEVKYPKVSIRMGAPFDCITFAQIGCSAAKNKLLISASGEVFPCEAFKFLKGTRPSIYQSTIKEIWYNDSLLYKLRSLNMIENCSVCEHYSICGGGCPGERMLFNGSVSTGPEPWCLYGG